MRVTVKAVAQHAAMYKCKYPHLFTPITLAGTVFRNRIFASPTGSTHLTGSNFPIPETNAYYERKALGGVASVCVGDAVVDSKHARFNNGHIALDHPKSYPSLVNLAESITRHGAVASIELSHSGSHSRASALEGNAVYGPVGYESPDGYVVEAMSEEKIYEVIEQHAKAAAWAKRCGFGMVTIHGGHGWLITEFLSPISNTRRDRWGGGIENRSRFAVEICKAVRRAVGPNFPIEMRISGSECHPGGYDIDEGVAIAKQLDGHLDLIHVSAGSHEVWDVFTVTHPDMFLPDGVNVKYAAEIKKHVKTAVATVGALVDPEQMEEIIASGKADVVEVARGLFADPDLPAKARAGKSEEINKCMRCLSCFSSLIGRGQFLCAINPVIGRETENKWVIQPARPKKVLIAGGGIAGMQAALTARERGHEVILCEKSDELGGVLRCEDAVPFKKYLSEYIKRQASRVHASGAKVLLNTEAAAEFCQSHAPDVIIAALGAMPVVPRIPGIEGADVYGAQEIYNFPDKAGARVVILGGGLVGSELAIYLSQLGRNVMIVEMQDSLNDGGNMLQGLAIRLELERQGVDVRLSACVTEITRDGVRAMCPDGEVFFDADTVVNAAGQRALSDIADKLRFIAPEFHQIGDCLIPRNISEATRAAYNTARNIGRFY